MLRDVHRCGYGQKNYPIHNMSFTSDTHKIKARIAEYSVVRAYFLFDIYF